MRPLSDAVRAQLIARAARYGIDERKPCSIEVMPAGGVVVTQHHGAVVSDHPGVPLRHPYTKVFLPQRTLDRLEEANHG